MKVWVECGARSWGGGARSHRAVSDPLAKVTSAARFRKSSHTHFLNNATFQTSTCTRSPSTATWFEAMSLFLYWENMDRALALLTLPIHESISPVRTHSFRHPSIVAQGNCAFALSGLAAATVIKASRNF